MNGIELALYVCTIASPTSEPVCHVDKFLKPAATIETCLADVLTEILPTFPDADGNHLAGFGCRSVVIGGDGRQS